MRIATTEQIHVARDLVATRLREWRCDRLVDVAQLLTSELVANALRHGAPPIDVEVTHGNGKVRVAVSDRGLGMPVVRPLDRCSPGGLGMVIVSELAASWGVSSQGDGAKLVWFDLVE